MSNSFLMIINKIMKSALFCIFPLNINSEQPTFYYLPVWNNLLQKNLWQKITTFSCYIIPTYTIEYRLLQHSSCINKQLWAKYYTKVDEILRNYKHILWIMRLLPREGNRSIILANLSHHWTMTILRKTYSRIHQYIKRGSLWQL